MLSSASITQQKCGLGQSGMLRIICLDHLTKAQGSDQMYVSVRLYPSIIPPRRHCPSRHTMPNEVCEILGEKTWLSPNAETSLVALAAWQWLHHYLQTTGNDANAGGLQPSISAARFTKLVQPHVMMSKSGNEPEFFASLGNARWAALGWPLTEVNVAGHLLYKFSSLGAATWFHVTDLNQWQVWPTEATMTQEPDVSWLQVAASIMALFMYFCAGAL